MSKARRVPRRGGLFLVLEGIDGSGTTTQGRRLVRRLRRRGFQALFTAEPSRGVVGRHIRRCLAQDPGPTPERLALLFAADRLDHYETLIAPALARGAVVVSDRYALSSLAYQGTEGDSSWVEVLNSRAPRPDLTVLLDVPTEEAARRRGARGSRPDRYEVSAFLHAVAKRYRRLSARSEFGSVKVLDGSLEPRVIGRLIDDLLTPRLRRLPRDSEIA